MIESKNRKILLFSLLAIAITIFIGFTGLIMGADVQAIGPDGSKVGFATMNKAVNKLVNEKYTILWNVIGDIILYINILMIFGVGAFLMYQWGKKRSLFKVDKELLIYIITFFLLISFWIIFDYYIVVNYRPILVDGKLESSYPSTHVMVVTFVSGTGALLVNKYAKIKNIEFISVFIAVLFVSLTLASRVLSGEHWITDVIGGFMLGMTLILVYICGASLFQYPDRRR
ncbi:MAG: phosphatase PAP2 family protein [Bacilli bacterium]